MDQESMFCTFPVVIPVEVARKPENLEKNHSRDKKGKSLMKAGSEPRPQK